MSVKMAKRKRKGMSERDRRLKNRQRMRNTRQQEQISSDESDQPFENSATSRGEVEGAVSAPLGCVPGQVSMGFPLKEEKPLARMQASLREKMHPNALSSASSQGSRLCAQNGGMAPSPDSPPWVCTSLRVPEPDTVHVSGSAGQAQLDMSSSLSGDESSRISIDAPRNLTRTEKYTERKSYENTVYMQNDEDDDDDDDDVKDDIDDDENGGDDHDETNDDSKFTTNEIYGGVSE
nr:transcription initiation factor TFIID subunit 11-like [Crassostrea gigas]